ncbi:hypothetical protein [Modestobacter versicolor]|uniref:hypothetical protein n=1 Tax=Modestobacter versicolor TaxID=429133 RepID=UPI0034DED446
MTGGVVTGGTATGAGVAGRRGGPLTRMAGRAGLNLVDQALSALTNVVLAFLVARAVTAGGFGAFAVAFLVFSLLIGFERSLVGQPMSIRFSAAEGVQRQQAASAGIATTVAVTLLAGAVVAVAGVLLGGVLGVTLLALAPVLPGLVVQDACRLVFFAQRRPHLAVVNDVVWAAVQFPVMGVLAASGVDEPWPYVLAWGGAATVAAALGVVQLHARPRVDQVAHWVRAHIDITGYLMLEYVIGAGSAQGSILLVGAVGSLDDVGSLRAAQTLLGPLGIVTAAIRSFLLPEVSRRTDLAARTRWRLAAAVSAVVVAGSLVFAGLLQLVPDGLGTELLGDTWPGASSVLLPLSLASAAAGACMGPAIVIYAMGQARRTFLLHAFEAPLVIACTGGGVHLGGTVGAAWGMALSMTVMVPLWAWQLRVLLTTPAAPDERPRDGRGPGQRTDQGLGGVSDGT